MPIKMNMDNDKHIRILITIEKGLYDLLKKYKVKKVSHICERALRDYLKENYGVNYELAEEKKAKSISRRVLELIEKAKRGIY